MFVWIWKPNVIEWARKGYRVHVQIYSLKDHTLHGRDGWVRFKK
jgi:hypothetical protein